MLKRMIACVMLCGILALIVSAACSETPNQIRDQNNAAKHDAAGSSPNTSLQDKSPFELRRGDCITDTFGTITLTESSTQVVACDSILATGRVTNLFTVDADGSYPAEDYFEAQFNLYCDYDATAFYFPTRESWSVGDRTIACVEEF